MTFRVRNPGFPLPEKGLLGSLGLLFIALTSALGRPIWIDETAQFAMGAFDNAPEAWAAFLRTAGNMNHGQTGAYYMLGHWLMRAFGANVYALRLPAQVFGVFLLFSARHFFVQIGLAFRWQIFGLLAFFCHPWIAGYFAEARPYIILAACSVGSLAYYSTPLVARSSARVRFIGWASIVMGGLFHPYFSLYWLATCVLGFIVLSFSESRRPPLLKHCNLALSLVGVAVYFGIAYPTWLSHHASLGTYDPFQWIPKQWSVGRYLYATHFLFLRMLKIPMTVLFGAVVLAVLARPHMKKFRRRFVSALSLLFVALTVSAFISYLSYKNHYWILERQWIASCALCVIGATWFCALMSRALPTKWSRAWDAAVIGFIVVNSLYWSYDRARQMSQWLANPDSFPRITAESTMDDAGGWEMLARANCSKGGPVWPEFKKMF